jgi:hypothetical protein
MKRLLLALFTYLLVVTSCFAQYSRLGHSKQLLLIQPVNTYRSLADTAGAVAMQFQPGEVVSLKGFVNARWLVLSQFFNYKEVDLYVQQEELGWTVLFDYLPPTQGQPPKKSRFRLFSSHRF